MREFTVFVDEVTDGTLPDAPPSYMIALSPSGSGGGMGTRRYSGKEELTHDLKQRLGYTDGGVEQFFASEDKHQQLINHALSDEDAAYLGSAI